MYSNYCMRYCTTTLPSAGLVPQPAAAVCTATVRDAPAAIILRDRAAVVGHGTDGQVDRRSAISEPDDGIGGCSRSARFSLALANV